MVNKKAVFIATIVAVLVIGVIFAFNVNKLDKENSNIEENTNASSNINVNKNETETNKTVENNVNDENTTNTTAEANTVKEENTNNSTENTNTSSNQKDKAEEYEVSAEGAIKLLKTKIKQRENTYFYAEDEISEGVYIISLRDETTTAEIASYKVDVKKKTVTEN